MNTDILNFIVPNLDILYFIVTGVGVLVTLFSLFFIGLGKKITGTDGQEIRLLKGVEIRTNSVIMLLIVSVGTTVFPLYLYNSGEIKELRKLARSVYPKRGTVN